MNSYVTPQMLTAISAEIRASLHNKPPLIVSEPRPKLWPPHVRPLSPAVIETPQEIGKLNSALAYLTPDALRGQGKLYEPGEFTPSNDYWLLVVWAIASLGWTSGKDIAREWSKRSTRYSDEGFEKAWSDYRPSHATPTGIGSLYKLAMSHGWQASTVKLELPPPNAMRYKLLSPADIQALPPLQWRVKHVLPATGIAAIFGPSGSGKSFLALDLAAAIAQGAPWFNIRTHQAPVVYVMLEGEGGIRNRISALEAAKGALPAALFSVIAQPFQLTTPEDVADLAAVIPNGTVVFIDTLNRAAPTSDENSSKEMGIILQAVKDLQSSTGGLIVVVHHTGKDTTRGMRGHSSLHAALDAAIEVARPINGRTWTVTKAKDGEDGKQVPFKLDLHTLGQDSDGEDITSCSVSPDMSMIFVKPEPKGAQQIMALKALKSALSKVQQPQPVNCCPSGTPCMRVEDAVDAIAKELMTTLQSKRKNRARALINSLTVGGYIGSGIDPDGEAWCWIG